MNLSFLKKIEINKQYIYLLPILFIIFFIPMIVFLYEVTIPEYIDNVWHGKSPFYDFFSTYKSYFLLGATLIALVIFFLQTKENDFKIKRTWLYIPMVIYLIFVIISTLLSEYSNISWLGFLDRKEGALILITYIIILFISFNVFDKLKKINIAINTLVISSFILGIIGLIQYFLFDPLFETNIGRSLISTNENYDIVKNLDISTSNIINLTFANSNYVGSYMAMLFPISLALYLLATSRKLNIFYGIYTAVMFVSWIGCYSRAGMVGGFIAVAIFLLLTRKKIRDYLIKLLIIIPVYLLLFIIMNIHSDNSLFTKIETLNEKQEETYLETSKSNLEDIKIENNIVKVITSTETLNIEIKGQNINFYDEDKIFLKKQKDIYGNTIINDNRYKRYSIVEDLKNNIYTVKIDKMKFYLHNDGTNVGIVYKKLFYTSINYPETFGFKGRETFGSSRGYIWSRSIPMLKNTLITGYGPDTFVFYFPQYDFVGKIKAYNTNAIAIDKPHNLYLQIGINTGVISLIAMLIVWGYYIINSLKLYIKETKLKTIHYTGIIIFVSIIGYLITGIFNDSVVFVAPVFWILLGLGMSCNYIIENKSKDKKQDFKD